MLSNRSSRGRRTGQEERLSTAVITVAERRLEEAAEKWLDEADEKYGDKFTCGMGAEAVLELLKKIEDKNDLKSEEESEHLTLNEAASAADNDFRKAFISKLTQDGKDNVAKALNKFEFKKADTASVDEEAGIIYYTTEEDTAKAITSASTPG